MQELMLLLVTILIRLALKISVLCLSVLDAFYGTATTMGIALIFHDLAFVTEPFTLHLSLDTRACFVRCSRDGHLWLACSALYYCGNMPPSTAMTLFVT